MSLRQGIVRIPVWFSGSLIQADVLFMSSDSPGEFSNRYWGFWCVRYDRNYDTSASGTQCMVQCRQDAFFGYINNSHQRLVVVFQGSWRSVLIWRGLRFPLLRLDVVAVFISAGGTNNANSSGGTNI